MPPMKIQPVDFSFANFRQLFPDNHTKTPPKSLLKRLFDRPLTSVTRISLADTEVGDGETPLEADPGPSSACLTKMVRNFMEESNEKQSVSKCVRNRCNCFSISSNDRSESDDELDFFGDFTESKAAVGSCGDASGALKGLVPCASTAERNLLADVSKIVDKNKSYKRKTDLKKIIADNLLRMGYDSSICKSKWEKTPSYPSGEYEYIDVIMDGERLLIDIDFRSEFEIARSTGTYKAVLQLLPYIFVGKTDRLAQIVRIVSNAANQSLKKKGMPFPPWRKVEYMQAKWLAPYTRTNIEEAIYFN